MLPHPLVVIGVLGDGEGLSDGDRLALGLIDGTDSVIHSATLTGSDSETRTGFLKDSEMGLAMAKRKDLVKATDLDLHSERLKDLLTGSATPTDSPTDSSRDSHLGEALGLLLALRLGDALGDAEGLILGEADGDTEGLKLADGLSDGLGDGLIDGLREGGRGAQRRR